MTNELVHDCCSINIGALATGAYLRHEALPVTKRAPIRVNFLHKNPAREVVHGPHRQRDLAVAALNRGSR